MLCVGAALQRGRVVSKAPLSWNQRATSSGDLVARNQPDMKSAHQCFQRWKDIVPHREHRLRAVFEVHLGRIDIWDCAGDEQACSLAIEEFNEQDRNRSIEVWDRSRMVFRYP